MTKWFSYSAGICFSAVLHGVLLAALIIGWQLEPEPRKLVRPKYIEATLLEVKPKVRPAQVPIKPVENRAEKLRREKDLKQQKIKNQARIDKKNRETAAKAKAARDKVLKDKALKDKALKDKALKDKAEKERARRERERQEQEQNFLDALAEEEAFIENEQLIGSYSAYIQERVVNNWSRPASARRGMVAELAIQLVPTGRVVSVTVLKSSGDDAFDRSAERAVSKVDRFERLQELSKSSPALFDREFRRFRLVFKPEDLRL